MSKSIRLFNSSIEPLISIFLSVSNLLSNSFVSDLLFKMLILYLKLGKILRGSNITKGDFKPMSAANLGWFLTRWRMMGSWIVSMSKLPSIWAVKISELTLKCFPFWASWTDETMSESMRNCWVLSLKRIKFFKSTVPVRLDNLLPEMSIKSFPETAKSSFIKFKDFKSIRLMSVLNLKMGVALAKSTVPSNNKSALASLLSSFPLNKFLFKSPVKFTFLYS